MQKRSRQLTKYLQGIVGLDGILKHPEVRAFLTTTVSGKNEDELVPAFGARGELSSKAVESIIESEDSDEDEHKEQERKSKADARKSISEQEAADDDEG